MINDTEVNLPSSLSEITLGQRIEYHDKHGRTLDKMLDSIVAMEEGIEKELEMVEFQFEKMCRTFAFFANVTVEAVKESKYLDDIAKIYYSSLAVLIEDEKNLPLQRTFAWNDEVWEIPEPVLKHGDKMKFGEFVESKQIVKDLSDLGAGNWEIMLRLCVIYLRKKGEAYQEEFLYDDSDRLRLMRTLPMDMAMQVGFFLMSLVNFYLNTLTYSVSPEPKAAASTPGRTLTATAG